MAKAKLRKGHCRVINAGKRCVCRAKSGRVSFKKAVGGRCRGKMPRSR
jgi:hypothetical protein